MSKKGQYKNQNMIHHLIKIIIACCLVLFLILIMFFLKDKNNHPIVGTWSLDDATVFQFDNNGKGTMILPSTTYEFTYEIDEQQKTVNIDYVDERAVDYTYSYKVDDVHLTLYGNVDKETFEYMFTRK